MLLTPFWEPGCCIPCYWFLPYWYGSCICTVLVEYLSQVLPYYFTTLLSPPPSYTDTHRLLHHMCSVGSTALLLPSSTHIHTIEIPVVDWCVGATVIFRSRHSSVHGLTLLLLDLPWSTTILCSDPNLLVQAGTPGIAFQQAYCSCLAPRCNRSHTGIPALGHCYFWESSLQRTRFDVATP